MDDVINRKAAVRIAREYCHPENIARELERMPSAIIRCLDCKHWRCIKGLYGIIGKCVSIEQDTASGDFCSFAERKTDD